MCMCCTNWSNSIDLSCESSWLGVLAFNGDFYVALGSSMSLALLVWVGGGLLTRVLYFFC